MSRSRRSVKRLLVLCCGVPFAQSAWATTYTDSTGDNYGPAYVDLVSTTISNDASNITFQINVNPAADLTQPGQQYADYEIGFHTAATGASGSTALSTPYGNMMGISTGMDYWLGAFSSTPGAQLYQWNAPGQPAGWALTGGFGTSFTPNIATVRTATALTITAPLSLFNFAAGSKFNFDVWTTFGSPGGQGAYDALDNPQLTGAQPYSPVVAYDSATAPHSTFSTTVYTVTTAVTPVWQTDGDGDWNNGVNWAGGIVPNGVGAEADFLSAITAPHTVSTATPITVGTIRFNNINSYTIAGAGSLSVQTTSGNGLIDVQAGSHQINLPLTIVSNTALNVVSGSVLGINGPLTVNSGTSLYQTGTGTVNYSSSIALQSAAIITFGNSFHSTGLTLTTSSAAFVASHGTNPTILAQVDQLSFGGTTGNWLGTVDLNNNDMIVHGGSIANVTNQVAEGYNGGNWNGSGGIVSAAAGGNTSFLTALGVILNSQSGTTPLYGTGRPLGTFDGTSPAATDVLVRYTYYGDANLDGRIDGSDYTLIDNGYHNQLTGWYNGDFNYDGVVNGSDYTLIDNAFNTQGADFVSPTAIVATQLSAGDSAVGVPEPTWAMLINILPFMSLRRRRLILPS